MSEGQDVRTLYAESVLGRDTEDFLASDIGRYVIARAEEEERDALEKLSRVSPWRRRRIAQLQAEVWRAQSVKGWLGELIVRGRQALHHLEATEE